MPDLAITSLSFPQNTQLLNVQLEEAAAAFDVVRLNSATRKYVRSVADSIDNANAEYIILSGGGIDAWVGALRLSFGVNIILGATMTPGDQYVVSANAGKVAPRSDLIATNVLTHLFVGATATDAVVNLLASGVTL